MPFISWPSPRERACNLHCDYCFFLEEGANLYPGSRFRMTDEVHEAYIRQLFEAHPCALGDARQGGEPTLMGLDFYRRSVELQKKHARPGVRIENTFQTNGILLNDEWYQFFSRTRVSCRPEHGWPEGAARRLPQGQGGQGTFDRVGGRATASETTRWSSTSCARSTRRMPTAIRKPTSTGSSGTNWGPLTSSSSRLSSVTTKRVTRKATV